MSDIKGLLFDKDGTLFDFAATWTSWAEAVLNRASRGDGIRARRAGRAIGFDLDARRFERDSIVIAGTPDEVAGTLMPYFAELSRDAVLEMLNEEAERAPQRQAVPLAPLLRELRARGLRLGVATNDAEEPARAHLHSAQVTEYFDFIAGFDSGHGGKPSPGQMLAFAAAVGLDPASIAMIGDSARDMHAGRAAGMVTVAVLTGPAATQELAPYADIILPDIGHLPDWLGRDPR